MDQIKLSKIINEILWKDWDPIGCGVPEDEYEGYVPAILNLLLDNTSEEKIAEQLNHNITVNMGLRENKKHCLEIAKKLVAIKIHFYK